MSHKGSCARFLSPSLRLLFVVLIMLPMPGIVNVLLQIKSHSVKNFVHKFTPAQPSVDRDQNHTTEAHIRNWSTDATLNTTTTLSEETPQVNKSGDTSLNTTTTLSQETPQVNTSGDTSLNTTTTLSQETPQVNTSGDTSVQANEYYQYRTTSNKCPGLKPTTIEEHKTDVWQDLEKKKSFVFSAYTDPRQPGKTIIHVMAITLYNYSRDLAQANQTAYCQLWFPGDDTLYVYPAKLLTLSRDVEKYASGMFDCILHYTQDNLPAIVDVSVSIGDCQPPTNRIRLHINNDLEKPKYEFAVCLSGPLVNNYNDHGQFVQWLEIQKVFGAGKVVVYNQSVSAEIDNYFKFYDEWLDKVSWQLPTSIGNIRDNVLWHYGQQVIVNDCLYRYMYATKYLVFVDLDELIVPRCDGCMTWSDMMTQVQANCSEQRSHYSFMKYIFPTQVKDNAKYDKNSSATKLKLTALLKTYRGRVFAAHNESSTFILRPTIARHNNIHTVYSSWGNKPLNDILCGVSPDVGAVHHYRTLWGVIRDMVIDPVMLKFDGLITERVKTLYEKYNIMLWRNHKEPWML